MSADAPIGPGASLWPSPKEEELRRRVPQVCRELGLARRYGELDRTPEFPRKEWKAFAARGWLGGRVDPKFGGQGGSLHDEAVLLEELAYHGGSVFAKLVLQPDFCSPLLHGSAELIDRWYRPLLRGDLLIGNQITEPGAGSDAGALQMVAEPAGSDFVLTGTKSEIAFASEADAAIVYARAPGTEGSSGVSAFLVPQDLPGISNEIFPDLGERWMKRGSVRYEGVRLPASHLIGEKGQGFSYLQQELTPERALLALLYVSVALSSWDETRSHVAQRRSFGRPLSAQQGVSFPMMDDLYALESCRLYTWDLLRRLEQDPAHPDHPAFAALAKANANEVALTALEHAMQFHGGSGYSSRLPHEQRWRDVRSGSTAHGSSEVLRMVAARTLLGGSAREERPKGPDRKVA